MRKRLYLPKPIDSAECRKAVAVLSYAVAGCTRLTRDQVAERILRLLGHLCKDGGNGDVA